MIKTFYFTKVEHGFVELDIPNEATEEEIEEMVREAENQGQAVFNKSEIMDIIEERTKRKQENDSLIGRRIE